MASNLYDDSIFMSPYHLEIDFIGLIIPESKVIESRSWINVVCNYELSITIFTQLLLEPLQLYCTFSSVCNYSIVSFTIVVKCVEYQSRNFIIQVNAIVTSLIKSLGYCFLFLLWDQISISWKTMEPKIVNIVIKESSVTFGDGIVMVLGICVAESW